MISVFMIINKFYFKIEGSFNLFNFEFGSSRTETIVNVVILAIAAVSLFFFYLESHNLKFNGIIGNIKIFQAREQVIIKGSTFNNYNDSHHTDQHPEDIELRLIKSIKKLHTKIQNPIDTEDINKIQNRYKRVKKKNIELKLSIPDDIAKLVADYLDSDFQEFKKKVLDGDKEEIYELLIKKIL